MNILNRYILREHAGPLVFAFIALTSIMLLNYISRQFGELVGKGLPWSVIGEFFLLAIPFTVALTIPMSVLVAVLYAFSRLAAENEVTALKASGVSPWRLVSPALVGGAVMSILLLAFNDQVLPRANHELKNLQEDISQAKPTFLLKDQVINPVVEGKFYLKAGTIDRSGSDMLEVVIYDLGNPTRRRTIYADTGHIAFAANRVDIDLELRNGVMFEVSTDKPDQLSRLAYKSDRIRIRDVGRDFRKTESDSMSKGDREMSICEMQRRFWGAERSYQVSMRDFEAAQKSNDPPAMMPAQMQIPEPRGLGWAYCKLLDLASVKKVEAAELQQAQAPASQAPVSQQVQAAQPPPPSVQVPPTFVPPAESAVVPQQPAAQPAAGVDTMQQRIAAEAAAELMRGAQAAVVAPATPESIVNSRTVEAKMRLDFAERSRNRYDVEIHKKFSLAAACLIFCILGPPIALRFPRGGVGLVIGVSLGVFALYYVGLIGGETLANKGYLSPFWAMWGTNAILTLVGLVMMLRIGRDSGSGRGGGLREWFDTRKLLRDERRAAAATGRAA